MNNPHHTLRVTLKKWSSRLVELPEHGMGLQYVNILLRDGTVLTKITVYNCEDIVFPFGTTPCTEQDIVTMTEWTP